MQILDVGAYIYIFHCACDTGRYNNDGVDNVMTKIMFRVMMVLLMLLYYYFPYVLLPCTNQLNFAVISSNNTLHQTTKGGLTELFSLIP